ncbi:hypothetical protein GCM10023319_43900 [Nocardia iowensis]
MLACLSLTSVRCMRGRTTQWGPVLGLLLVAPFIGEFLLGNMTLAELPVGLLLAPMYGCGALLVREVGRRWRGWPTMVLLAAAYALFEEGPVDQLLWNDSYAGHDLLHGPSFIPAIGMSVELTQAVLALHTVWSVCVPIALVEAIAVSSRDRPWLGRTGLIVTAVLFVLGATLVFAGNYSVEHFIAAPGQIAAVVAVMVVLVVAAFVAVPARRERTAGDPPAPLLVGLVSFAVTSAYWGPSTLIVANWYEWVGVAVWFFLVAIGVCLVLRWTQRAGWTEAHTCALAVGATLTYVWVSFPTRPESGGSVVVDLASNVVFGVLACSLVLWATRRAAREPGHGPWVGAASSGARGT